MKRALSRARRRAAGAPRRRRIILAAVVIAVIAAGGGGMAYALAGPAGPQYRTALATNGSVVQQASDTGTVNSVSQHQAAFQLDGVVESVAVSVGGTVEPGQTLAILDPADLDESVRDAEDALADAEDQLAADLEAQASGASSATTARTGQGAAVNASASGGGAAAAATNAVYIVSSAAAQRPVAGSAANVPAGQAEDGLDEVNAAIEAVKGRQGELLVAYDSVAGLLERAEGSLADSDAACASFMSALFPSSGDPDADAGELEGIKQSLRDCQVAIGGARAAQSELGASQRALLQAADDLNNAVSDLTAALDQLNLGSGEGDGPTDPETPSDPETPGTPATPGVSPESPGGLGGSTERPGADSLAGGAASGNGGAVGATQGTSVTAEQILSDQAQIELLEAELAIAVNQRQAATLTSLIGGTIVAVNVAAGDSVTSGQVAVVVDGGHGFTVTLTMGLSTVKELSVGNPATFAAGSTDQELTGQIAAIGITNQSNTSVPSFVVELTVDQADATLYAGARIAVVITVASSDNVVTVPTSAVHVSGDGASVQMEGEAGLMDVPVAVGAMGAELTEITDGVALGDRVVLADLSKNVIEEASSSSDSAGSSLLGGNNSLTGGRNGLSVNVVPGGGGMPGPPQ
ncbi:MAG: biotin/lipoyl-binding protein [Bifidobacteriaceae bacterium]|jgi:multidrug efflux pump subunit AcrA (membrane-fusion protein)|nr:biotin/lipoyl-binding protein [Bifidobacteriaceae bacterium]